MDDLNYFKNWFTDFCKAYYSLDSEDQKNISLKENHTFNVCKHIIEIARELSFSNNEIMLAETIALFHDIGRFPQYAKYKTFNDSISVNHGVLGAHTLLEEKILKNLTEDEQKLIIRSVRFHNAYSLPADEEEGSAVFIKLIRDADKLDIWRVFIEYYESSQKERASAVSLGLPDTAEYSEEILSCIHRKQMVSLSKVKTLNDFKLMQLSWIFDLNFKTSFRLLLERNYIDRIISQLPQEEDMNRVSSALKEFVHMRVNYPAESLRESK